MIEAVGIVIEFIISSIAAGVLFLFETAKNGSPKKNAKKAYHYIRDHVKKYNLYDSN